MESKLAKEAKLALIAATQRLTPEQRLNAFLAHCQFMMELHEAGRQLRPAPRRLPRGAHDMFWEIAQIEVKAGEEPAFEAAVGKAVPLFRKAKGCRGMQIQRSVEHPTRYRLVVDWETVEDHTVHFRESDDFREWRRLVGGFFASPPVVEHTHRLPLGF